jgi:hypothetical protein
MKKVILGVLISFGLATTLVMAEQATEQHRGMIGGMMQRMMGEQKPGEQSQEMMQDTKGMMARMSKMMDMCNQMNSNASHPKKDESSK